jgi:hypothetical protein
MAHSGDTRRAETVKHNDNNQQRKKRELWKLVAAALFILVCLLAAMELFNGTEFGDTEGANQNPPPHSIDQ